MGRFLFSSLFRWDKPVELTTKGPLEPDGRRYQDIKLSSLDFLHCSNIQIAKFGQRLLR